jgi:hypothetical protein
MVISVFSISRGRGATRETDVFNLKLCPEKDILLSYYSQIITVYIMLPRHAWTGKAANLKQIDSRARFIPDR